MSNNANIFNSDAAYVNGPINVVRLEGSVAGIPKVIYLFLEIHQNLREQTESKNIYSRDVHKYLADIFYKLNNTETKYDFFMEIVPTDIDPSQNTDGNNIYILKLRKFFSEMFEYDSKNNLVKPSETFRNVRFHYLDIRDYLSFNIYFLLHQALLISRSMRNSSDFSSTSLQKIMNILANVVVTIDQLIEIFKSSKNPNDKKPLIDPKNQEKVNRTIDPNIIHKLFHKLRESYKHPEIRDKLVFSLKLSLLELGKLLKEIDQCIKLLITYMSLYEKTKNKLCLCKTTGSYVYGLDTMTTESMLFEIDKSIYRIFISSVSIFAKITDVYFLRRFLDKDYITNAIVYTGYGHSLNYINLLVSQFGFKVTHCSYNFMNDMEKLNKQIKKFMQPDPDISRYFLPPVLQQASDMSKFPDSFK